MLKRFEKDLKECLLEEAIVVCGVTRSIAK